VGGACAGVGGRGRVCGRAGRSCRWRGGGCPCRVAAGAGRLGLARPSSAGLGPARRGGRGQARARLCQVGRASHPAGDARWLSSHPMRVEQIYCKRVSIRLDMGGESRHSRDMQSKGVAFNGASGGLPSGCSLSPTQGRYVLQEDSNGNRIACRYDKGARSGYTVIGYSDSWDYASEWRGY